MIAVIHSNDKNNSYRTRFFRSFKIMTATWLYLEYFMIAKGGSDQVFDSVYASFFYVNTWMNV